MTGAFPRSFIQNKVNAWSPGNGVAFQTWKSLSFTNWSWVIAWVTVQL